MIIYLITIESNQIKSTKLFQIINYAFYIHYIHIQILYHQVSEIIHKHQLDKSQKIDYLFQQELRWFGQWSYSGEQVMEASWCNDLFELIAAMKRIDIDSSDRIWNDYRNKSAASYENFNSNTGDRDRNHYRN